MHRGLNNFKFSFNFVSGMGPHFFGGGGGGGAFMCSTLAISGLFQDNPELKT